MAKRRLNHQQQRRIARKQARQADGSGRRGLVIAHHGREVAVESQDGDDLGTLHRCHFRANLGTLVAGDEVVWHPTEDGHGVVEALAERRSLLERPDRRGRLKPVAANIDRVFLMIAVEPEPHDNLIDRYLVAAELVGLEPVLLLNKTDRISDDNRPALSQLLQRYEALGYHTAQTSQNDSATELHHLFMGHTSIVAGQSGVGKSSLIRRLLSDDRIRTGAVSDSTGRGTHTTTTAQLYHLPAGGDLIDSPGIREFALGHLELADLTWGFREIRPLTTQCRFRDCRHRKEPGCAVKAAFEDGRVSPERAHSFERIRHEIEATS
ncbi:ribosome biogenesis GTPase RsgA [Tamilnaduibacter salinus]|uniref:Small ribosomal subunit biogenesis GTPase RsgA n=1 Tax=Tamilnaduibacter salinus TaxID=1484056 RepID=A0A2A2I4Z7_9GAMM|nr:small ribosomal subunit biogenesis GTPase RsgA [Tamilnaduibacter salinus]PAV26468.1 ribosome biogenesis GTPase RsgA [Tamilnaduibacter salinus]